MTKMYRIPSRCTENSGALEIMDAKVRPERVLKYVYENYRNHWIQVCRLTTASLVAYWVLPSCAQMNTPD